MTRYRKKPVEIDAFQLTDTTGNTFRALDAWLDQWYDEDDDRAAMWLSDDTSALIVHTLEGDMRASVGDWIIRGVQGELYPCKPAIFEATYDAVEIA